MDIHFKSLAEISRQIRARDISPVELTEVMLSRIETLDPQYHAYSRVCTEQARQDALAAEKAIMSGNHIGPLHGVPVAVKDLFQTSGIATSCGSIVMKDRIPTEDATAVTKLKQAGAVILGKLNMTEFALSGYHPELPVPVNPWGQDRWSGVSSSGSAVATATGMAFGTLGSDTGGSIRFPAAVNGVVGIKPTFGRVSKYGAFPLAYTLDHVGPIARTTEDAAILLQAIAGYDANDPFSIRVPVADYCEDLNSGIRSLRIGIDEAYCATDAHPEVTEAVLSAARTFEGLGAQLVPVNMLGVLEVCPFWGAVVAAEAAVAHQGLFPEQADQYGPVFRSALEAAPHISASDYAQARLAATNTKATFENLLDQVDVLLCPGAPLPAMPLEQFPPTQVLPPEAVASFVGFTAPMNFSGHPTISIPCGSSSDNLPLGLQLVGNYNAEAKLITAAHTFEQATDWHRRKPPANS
ncbi:MAG: amidase [bacterium]|nr:amidase [Gammaproteobacteria bacterium]HIL97707.1 amidase [Pseudomonadales bacterium]